MDGILLNIQTHETSILKPDEELNFSMDAAQLRKSGEHQTAYLEALARRLESGLPGMVSIARRFALKAKNRHISDIKATIGEKEYSLSYEKHTGIKTAIGSRVRGIVLKTEPVEFNDWLSRLNESVHQYAKSHSQTDLTLEDFLLRN